jgi:hypothetical protein
MRWTLGLFSCDLSKWHLFKLQTLQSLLSSSLSLQSMSRKAQRQLREAIISISYPYSRPTSCTHRAEDIITPEGSPQSTPHSIPLELPIIHEPTPVCFAGVVEPSPTCSLPKYNNYDLGPKPRWMMQLVHHCTHSMTSWRCHEESGYKLGLMPGWTDGCHMGGPLYYK